MVRVILPFRSDKKVQPYADALRSVGLEPVQARPDEPAEMGSARGLLLAGGTDVDPALYGEPAAPETDQPDPERDQLEFRLLTESLELDLPVLAICRGHQLLNVHQGGTLLQHIRSGRHEVRDRPVSDAVHAVTLTPDSRIGSIFRSLEVQVNSRHHQAVAEVAPSLKVTGISAEDEIVEGLEHPSKRFVVGVQWHPEDQIGSCEQQRWLFRAFADAL